MKTTGNTKTELIQVIKALKPREAVDGKKYPEYKKELEAVLDTVYEVYQAREKGASSPELESEAMKVVTAFLHTLGKANGKYISVCEKTSENGVTTVFFDTLVYNSFRDRIYTKSATLATAEAEKAVASRKMREAHTNFIEGKGTAKDYKDAVAKYNEANAKVQQEREEAEAEGTSTERESIAKFTKFTTARLKAIIENRYAISPEEAEAIRKLHNKATKEKRKPEAVKTEEAKKPEAKTTKKSNGKKAEAKKTETPKASKATPEKVKAQQEAQKPEEKPEAVKETTETKTEAEKKTA